MNTLKLLLVLACTGLSSHAFSAMKIANDMADGIEVLVVAPGKAIGELTEPIGPEPEEKEQEDPNGDLEQRNSVDDQNNKSMKAAIRIINNSGISRQAGEQLALALRELSEQEQDEALQEYVLAHANRLSAKERNKVKEILKRYLESLLN